MTWFSRKKPTDLHPLPGLVKQPIPPEIHLMLEMLLKKSNWDAMLDGLPRVRREQTIRYLYEQLMIYKVASVVEILQEDQALLQYAEMVNQGISVLEEVEFLKRYIPNTPGFLAKIYHDFENEIMKATQQTGLHRTFPDNK